MELLAIADDLTGALEAGAKFGGHSVVYTRRRKAAGARVVVIDTESRHLAPDMAAAAVAGCVTDDAALLYKKTDSTLRGNIAAELRALARLRPGSRIAYVPAYPALGRTVRDGVLYVDGVPVADTAFGRDPLNPIRDSRVSAAAGACDCTIFDGETTDDIRRTAAAILADRRYRIVAGPAAIAEALAERLNLRDAAEWPVLRNCLIVNGSRHPASARQIERARECLGSAWRILERDIEPGTPPPEVACATGRAVANEANVDGLVIFGGDTAFGILEAMGAPALRPLGEILPGVPVSRIEGRTTVLVTKAGGFGAGDLLCRLYAALAPASLS